MAAYRQDTLNSSLVAGRTAAPGWKPGTGEFMSAIASIIYSTGTHTLHGG